jgi:hypothetical protein
MDASFSMHCCVDSLNCSNVICLFLDLLSSCLTHYIGLDHTSLPITLTVIFSYINGLHDCREYREHVKDLSCVSKDFCRIVIVDNNPFSFILQPLNGIPCVPFSAGQHSDDQLMTVIFPLLKHLSLQKDVRPVLHERFHMPEWFQKHGIPQTNQAV